MPLSDIKSRNNYVRVTNILEPFSGLDHVDKEVLLYAAARGTKVHKTCEAIISGLGDFGIDEETMGYVESFKKWWGDGYKVHSLEERFFDEDLRVTGKCDLIIKTDKGLKLIDLKTSYKRSKTWNVQGNAYAYLAKKNGIEIQSIEFIHLIKDGSYPKIINIEIDFDLFLSVFKTWKYFYRTT